MVSPTSTASPVAPSTFPAYVLVNTTAGYAEKNEAFQARISAGCIDRFHFDSDNALQFDFTASICGKATDLKSQISPLFDLYKSDVISGDLLPDGTYVIQVYSTRIDDRRRRDFIKRRDAWTFTYNGVIPSSTTTSDAASSSSSSSSSSAPTSTAAASASASDEVPAESSSSAAPAATESAVQPASVTANLYQAGASASSVLTFGSVVAALTLFF
ncbi:hypothetical protein BJ741DRAFT_629126 [Chytriomyces cf. hyalinus JEL632]|nr:hypothetical protein BJ741DRAFT_629126 [Chytriomyces cf. hyalinus JEL632]